MSKHDFITVFINVSIQTTIIHTHFPKLFKQSQDPLSFNILIESLRYSLEVYKIIQRIIQKILD